MSLYGTPPGRSSPELKIEYQIRSIVVSQKISFRYGQKEELPLWLTVMQGILLEALNHYGNGRSGLFKDIRAHL